MGPPWSRRAFSATTTPTLLTPPGARNERRSPQHLLGTGPCAELQRRSEYARLKPKARRALEACAVLGISRATLYKLAAQEKIRLVKIAGRTLVPESEIDRLASEGTAEWGVADVP